MLWGRFGLPAPHFVQGQVYMVNLLFTDKRHTFSVQFSSVQSSPVQSSPVQSSPVQSSPVHSTPVQSSPVQSSPVQSSPVQSSPVQFMAKWLRAWHTLAMMKLWRWEVVILSPDRGTIVG